MRTSIFTVVACLVAGAYVGARFSTPTASAHSARDMSADVPVATDGGTDSPMVTLAPTVIVAKRAAKAAREDICNWDDVRAPREMSQGPIGRTVRGFCGGR